MASPSKWMPTGLLAVCIQHEMDHLEGKLFVDYLSELKRQLIRRRLEKERKQRSPGERHSRFRTGSLSLERASELLEAGFRRHAGLRSSGARCSGALRSHRAGRVHETRSAGRPRTDDAFEPGQAACARTRDCKSINRRVSSTSAVRETLRDLRLDALIVVAYGLILPPAAARRP